MFDATQTTALGQAIQHGMLMGAVLATIVGAGLTVWVNTRTERTVTSRPEANRGGALPDPGDPTVALARLRFAQGEIDSEELRRVLQALSRTWQA